MKKTTIVAGALLLIAVTVMAAGSGVLHQENQSLTVECTSRGLTMTEIQSVEISHSDGISVNSASQEELETLPGIGPKLAAAIITERETNGRFWYPEDLMAVSGIGDSKLAAIRDQISLEMEKEE